MRKDIVKYILIGVLVLIAVLILVYLYREQNTIESNNGNVINNDNGSISGEQSSSVLVDKEKLDKMSWSIVPKEGYVSGDYVYGTKDFFGGYTAIVKLVRNNNGIVLLEFDEQAPADYYEPKYARASKRFSDYGFFQAQSSRTDESMVVLVNGFNDAEKQYMESNDYDKDIKALAGASNSINIGFSPLVKEMKNMPNQGKYYSFTKYYDDFAARLEVVYDNDDKIAKVFYDEIFYDEYDQIKTEELKKYYRQSKYHSVDYYEQTGDEFKKFSDDIGQQVVDSQSFENLKSDYSDEATLNRFNEVLGELQKEKANEEG